MEDNTVTKAQSIDVTGYQSDVQVTGGLQVAAGNQGTAVGASVAVASLNNTLNAGIKGTGKNGLAYADVGNVEVHALSALTAVTAAVSAGATKTSKSDGTSVNIQGPVFITASIILLMHILMGQYRNNSCWLGASAGDGYK